LLYKLNTNIMFHSPFQRKLLNIKERLFPSEMYLEEAIAFVNRLPNDIQVHWQRDGKFIIGEITDGDHSYLTQAKSAKELVEMVNDVVYSVYGVKQKYFRILGENKYYPNPEEFEKLNNAAIDKEEMNFIKQVVQPASI